MGPWPIHGRGIIADDDAEDRLFLKQCLDVSTRLRVIAGLPNGAEALHYVSGTGPCQDRARHPLPDLLIIGVVNISSYQDILILCFSTRQRRVMVWNRESEQLAKDQPSRAA